MTRKELDWFVADHPGWVNIMGVSLDMSDGDDAAVAAKWLDKQLASVAAELALYKATERDQT